MIRCPLIFAAARYFANVPRLRRHAAARCRRHTLLMRHVRCAMPPISPRVAIRYISDRRRYRFAYAFTLALHMRDMRDDMLIFQRYARGAMSRRLCLLLSYGGFAASRADAMLYTDIHDV